MSPREVHVLAERIRGEFLEMPGLCLTLPQAARLWGLDHTVCRRVVDSLIATDFLYSPRAGMIARLGA